MDLMDKVKLKAKANPKRVCFPEVNDIKMLKAMEEVAKEGYARVVVVGHDEETARLIKENSIEDTAWEYIDITNESLKEEILAQYLKLPNLVYGEKSLRRRMNDPLYFALMMEAIDMVDVTFAGITSTSGDFILASQTIVGLKDGLEVVSSVGIAEIPGYTFQDGGHLIAIGDCAVCTNPTASELASIAIATCETVGAITDWDIRCALLSYSTDNSGQGELVDKVKTAVRIANELRPDLKIDGEFQLDSAIVPEVASKKVKRASDVAGCANVLIFPDLNAGNIGVKLIQQFGLANAYGPLLQGFRKICSDCSRSAPVSELVGNILFSVVRAGELQNAQK